MDRIIWNLRQLLPLTYTSKYVEEGQSKLSIWKMWFGRCFGIKIYELKEAK